MTTIAPRNRLMPWYIGMLIVVSAVIYVGYQMYTADCTITAPVGFLVLLVIPIVYLTLMYLTLTSQD